MDCLEIGRQHGPGLSQPCQTHVAKLPATVCLTTGKYVRQRPLPPKKSGARTSDSMKEPQTGKETPMKEELILPAAFAFTVHAFLLFGLPGKAPVSLPSALESAPKEDEQKVALDPEDFASVADDPEERTVRRDDGGAPRGEDFTTFDPDKMYIETPRLPPISSGPRINTIPVTWQNPPADVGPAKVHVFRSDELDRVPRARLQPAPEYPADLRNRRQEGTVTVEFMVDTNGRVYNPVVLHVTAPGFEETTLRAVARWKFEPGTRHNRRVHFRMSVPVVFTLQSD